ncbi:DUF2513 domain-containing protein [Cytobacillus kochii]|uniref:DUF2513 domain-containing protein n=1 Tax=Cytobacillus kochii TaxID=859143 RepID=UPI0025A06E3C|nr:DUF2513 domain-containing protein [Cytobacillus kochii]MDM5209218.1 DUF2513 domain-containing protein [Cytobacillus kochii]
MKRDMELVRNLLLLIEKNDDSKELIIPEEWNREIVAYHLKILDQAGYVKNNTKWADNKPMWLIASLTWDGHEFLDSIKNDNVWVKTKDGVKKKGLELGSIPFDVLKEFAKIQLKSILGF